MIRRVSNGGDLPAILSIAHSAYGDRDYTSAEAWLRHIIPQKNFAVFMGERAFTIGTIVTLPWQDTPTAMALFLTARRDVRRPVLEPLTLLRALADWAKSHGAPTLEAGSGSVYKIEPLFLRLGLPIERVEHFRVKLL